MCEVNLYPVLDDLLGDWLAAYCPPAVRFVHEYLSSIPIRAGVASM